MNIGQFALIKKDIRGITSNKQIFAVLLIVPLVLTIVLPSIFVFVISFAPDAASDFQKLLDMLPAPNGEYSQQQQIFSLILNQIMPCDRTFGHVLLLRRPFYAAAPGFGWGQSPAPDIFRLMGSAYRKAVSRSWFFPLRLALRIRRSLPDSMRT